MQVRRYRLVFIHRYRSRSSNSRALIKIGSIADLEERFYQRALSGDAAEATYQAELCLKDQSLKSCLDAVVLPSLKLAERDARRGLLDEQQTEKITDTVKEMMDNLSDFEPRRWFSQLRPKARDEEEETGLASLTAAESGEEEEFGSGSLRVGSGMGGR